LVFFGVALDFFGGLTKGAGLFLTVASFLGFRDNSFLEVHTGSKVSDNNDDKYKPIKIPRIT
jgi:hypothetical protein